MSDAARQHQRLLDELHQRLPDPHTELLKEFSRAFIHNNKILAEHIQKEREIKAGEDWAWNHNRGKLE